MTSVRYLVIYPPTPRMHAIMAFMKGFLGWDSRSSKKSNVILVVTRNPFGWIQSISSKTCARNRCLVSGKTRTRFCLKKGKLNMKLLSVDRQEFTKQLFESLKTLMTHWLMAPHYTSPDMAGMASHHLY